MTSSKPLLFGTSEEVPTDTQAIEDKFCQVLLDANDRRFPHYGIPSNLLESLQDALNQLPNTELDDAEYPDTYALASRLEYIVDKAKHEYWLQCRRDAGYNNNKE